eukprot:TRINITY_DN5913_c3_g1_i1.p1 TRINITY_DN5913_c3_g1~~TRINITY_DN5913_c3_g1_i1.p1  ORF type:complete len:506 (+),score=79.36 TRINITY_DN5913_c3_g1_i1:104-1519(+)
MDEGGGRPRGRSRRGKSLIGMDSASILEPWVGQRVRISENKDAIKRATGNSKFAQFSGMEGELISINRDGYVYVEFDHGMAEACFPTNVVFKTASLASITQLAEAARESAIPPGDCFAEFDDDETQMLPNPDTIKKKVWALVEPAYAEKVPSPILRHTGRFISYLTQVVILGSVAMILLSSLPDYTRGKTGDDVSEFIISSEYACVAYFTLEFILRLVSTPSQKEFWASGFTWIDLISILPFYIGLAGANIIGRSFQVLTRITRIARVLKVGRHSVGIRLFVLALRRSFTPLVWHMVAMLIIVVSSASVLYYVERESCSWNVELKTWYRKQGYSDSGTIEAPSKCMFQSIPETLWWAVVTLTTVGYGETYPVTNLGKGVASVVMVFSVLVMTFPLVILTNSFGQVYRSYLWARYRKDTEVDCEGIAEHFATHAVALNSTIKTKRTESSQVIPKNTSMYNNASIKSNPTLIQ